MVVGFAKNLIKNTIEWGLGFLYLIGIFITLPIFYLRAYKAIKYASDSVREIDQAAREKNRSERQDERDDRKDEREE